MTTPSHRIAHVEFVVEPSGLLFTIERKDKTRQQVFLRIGGKGDLSDVIGCTRVVLKWLTRHDQLGRVRKKRRVKK